MFSSARLPEFPRPRERPPYHNKGANETRRRNRLQSAKNSSLCERYCWGGCRKVPELTEEFAKQKSQKHEIRQIFNSWRRERDSNRESGPPYPFEKIAEIQDVRYQRGLSPVVRTCACRHRLMRCSAVAPPQIQFQQGHCCAGGVGSSAGRLRSVPWLFPEEGPDAASHAPSARKCFGSFVAYRPGRSPAGLEWPRSEVCGGFH
jgi:hypothetical protein